MNHHWETWLRTTLLWGMASLIVALVALHYKWELVLGISAISFILSIIHAIFKLAEKKKRRESIYEYEDNNGIRDFELPCRHHYSSHDDFDSHDNDLDFDYD